jgi:hypothetical protein
MTGQDPSPPGREPVITYGQAQDTYPSTIEARQRFDELTNRDLCARAFATLKARDTYDPAKHGDVGKYQPLTTAEHLELLAAGEVLARHYRHPSLVHQAVQADATWPQIAEAVGADETQLRQQYRDWADGQHRLHIHYQGKFGLNDADYATAIERVAEPPTGPENEREAGQ